MTSFHICLHARPVDAVECSTVSIDGTEVRSLRLPAETSGAAMGVSFEAAVEQLSRLRRLFVEPDGSFVWRAASGQIDGNLFDRGGRLLYAELKGVCDQSDFEAILSALGHSDVPLMIQFVRHAEYVDVAEFQHSAFLSRG